MTAPVRLGPVLLSHRIGTGGMGHVWLAQHPEGVSVAVKLLVEEFANDERLLDTFRFEVRAVASLDHPAIVRVYDYGVVPEEAAAASEGAIGAGAPWLAMEYASGGSFAERPPVASWEELSSLVPHLLDGLAHSHARGLVHRDLKPHNVLVRDDGTPTLTDFGIAHALTRESPTNAAAGTPGYMAPEQILGRIQDMGPWTDLYSLGSLVYTLLTGHPPFVGDDRRDVFLRQLNDTPPPVTAPFAIPDGGEAWLARMLERQPERRFRCAADAAWAFDQLDANVAMPPPLPFDWRSPRPPTTERPKGMGLAVFLLRPWPLVGRALEQDQLWEALRGVREDGEPRGVVVEGEAGLGTTRLARWIAERAHETGAAEVLWFRPPGREPSIRGALANHLRVASLDREDTAHVLRSWLVALGQPNAQGEANRFAALLTDDPEPTAADWIPLLRACATERPLVVVADDLHRSGPSAEIASAILDTGVPALVVGTLNPELVDGPALEPLRKRSLTLTLTPLPDGLQRELLDKGTGLAPRLSKELVTRTHGNPRYAVDAVSDWARRGLLVPTSTGFDLREAAAPMVPRSIRTALEERLAPLAREWPRAGELLEVLAALGGDRIRETDWLAVAAEAGIPAPAPLLDAIERVGLAKRRARPGRAKRWRLGHPLMRDTLDQRSLDAERHSDQHRAAGRALVRISRSSAQDRGLRHLVEVGEIDAAVRAVADLVGEADLLRRVGLHNFVEPLLERSEVDAAVVSELAAMAARDRSEAPVPREAAKTVLREVPTVAEERAEPVLAFVQVEYEEEDDELGLESEVDYDPTGAPGRGRPRTREVPLTKEPSLDAVLADPLIPGAEDVQASDAEGWLERGRALLRQGEPSEAATWLSRAEHAFEGLGDATGAARSAIFLGAVARARGELQVALECSRRARDTLRAEGQDASEGDLEIALVHVVRGELAQARFALERLASSTVPRVAFLASSALLCCVVEDRVAWRRWFGRTQELQRGNPVPEVDAAWPPEWAGRRAAVAGSRERAREALELAAERYGQLGDDASVKRVGEALAELGS